MVASDFFVVITTAFCTLYLFAVLEIGSRQILHYNATAHPSAEWTLQQFPEALPGDIPTASSSTIAIASSLTTSTRALRTWVREFCGRRCGPKLQTRCASDWAAASVSTS
jgi:hypothetical protein